MAPNQLWLFSQQISGNLCQLIAQAQDNIVLACGFKTTTELQLSLGNKFANYNLGLGPLDNPIALALAEYSSGNLAALDKLAVSQSGTTFQQEIWQAMRHIKPGNTISYTKLAQQAGHPRSYRAAASVCSNNQIAVIIPCHRVIRADGSLGGYAAGLGIKKDLLAHEARFSESK